MTLLRIVGAFASVATLALTACVTSPTGRSQVMLVSEAQMAEMGSEAFNQMKNDLTVSRDAATVRYVNCVAEAFIPIIEGGYAWELVVFEDEAANAFALPGGKIGVFTGLLDVAENQHQLATVIGHEIAHVTARHSAARVSTQLATQLGVSVLAQGTGMDPQLIGMGADLLLTLPFSRADESEGDRLGLDYMARAGFDPRQSVMLWRNMERLSGGGTSDFTSTHPSPQNRIQELERRMVGATASYESARAAGHRPDCNR